MSGRMAGHDVSRLHFRSLGYSRGSLREYRELRQDLDRFVQALVSVYLLDVVLLDPFERSGLLLLVHGYYDKS
ncbi:hypothetical protein LX32DRAFT_635986 [Colletotrichum zoysiae]|uniref:Uncharacterized protein n=1 Tax=Colletotrichum zoysiae TaxID=1216348 RepID=A0AAD9HPI8_9PEZI|nr:hypothetical protein LX32DRAFT_635986 [Colletotrichum zoysiae]